MSEQFYRISTSVSRKVGIWFFRVSAWFVATGYFLFFPSRVSVSLRFYKALFPQRSLSCALWCAWKQYHNFTSIFLDRFLFQDHRELTYTSEGWDHLENAIESKSGGILLMSHLGNWEVAAHLLKQKRPDIRLLLFMGIRNKEQIERIQKESLSRNGIRIVATGQSDASPLDIIDGIRFIQSGGLVSLAGDIVWHSNQRTVPARFLGHEVLLPEVPHKLALMTGAPLFLLTTIRTGDRRYHFSVTEPYHVRATSRAERAQAIQESVQHYANRLERILLQHPLEWYHFRPFLKKKLTASDEFETHFIRQYH